MTSFVYNVKVNAMQSAIDTAIKETIRKLSKKYEFDYQEAINFLGVEEKLRVTVGAKPRAPKREQPKFPLPFSGEQIDGCCVAILYNKGLYSQCLNEQCSNGLCMSCSKKASKTPFGMPEYGIVEERIQKGDDYTDHKGKKPVHFTQVMKKMKLTEEFVLGEVTKYNIPFDTNHFSEQQEKKGRPKKSQERIKKASNQIEISCEDDDLIAAMIKDGEMGNTPEPIQAPASTPEPIQTPTPEPIQVPTPANPLNLSLQFPEPEDDMSEITDEDNNTFPQVSQVKTKKTQNKLEKKALKETEKEAKKALKEAEKEAEKAAKKAKKEADKAEEKAKKEAEKAKKDAEERAKKEAEERAKKEAEEKANQKISSDELSVEKFDCDEDDKPKAKYVTFSGKKYIVKSEDNTVYDAETKIEVGYWNPTEKTIVFEEDEEDEEDEEEELAEDSDEED
jgi:hypothetical protein